MKNVKKTKRDLLFDTNREMQEIAQKLFMAKKELEKKNQALEEAQEKEKQEKEHLQRELKVLKQISGPARAKAAPPAAGKPKLTGSAAEELSLRYLQLLKSYVKTKDLSRSEGPVEELCRMFLSYGVTPKGIVDIHLKAMPQVKTIGDLETKRVTFESRMVLMKVIITYASLLSERMA